MTQPQASTTTSRPPEKSGGFDVRLGVMLAAAGACLLPWITPPIALAIGLVLALAGLTMKNV